MRKRGQTIVYLDEYRVKMWAHKIMTAMLLGATIALAVALLRDGHNETIARAALSRAAGLAKPAHMEAALSYRFPELDFDATPLNQALAALAARAHTAIDVDWKSLGATGVGPASPVKLHLQDANLSRALHGVLDATEWTHDAPGFVVADGVIVITANPREHRADQITVVYNVRDLIEASESSGIKQRDAAEALTTAIVEHVAPECWSDTGGSPGRIHEIAGLLVITQSAEAHEEIVRFLEQLRTADSVRVAHLDVRASADTRASGGNP